LRCDPFDFLLAQLKRPLEIQPLLQDQEEHYPIPMPRAKKPPQLSAKERALLNRLEFTKGEPEASSDLLIAYAPKQKSS
jgi:hypothetical protein